MSEPADWKTWLRFGCGVVCASALAISVQAAPWRIVLLPGTDPSQPAVVQQDRAFRRTLAALAPEAVEFYTDSLDGVRFEGGELTPEFVALLHKKYDQRPVDLVVGIGDPALEFTKLHHAELWPGKPVLILSMEAERLRQLELPPEFSYLPWDIDVSGTLEIAERLQPDARRLVVVSGVAEFDRYWAERAAEVVRAREGGRWSTEVWSGLPMPELQARLAGLDRRSTSVIYTSASRDQAGRTFFAVEAVRPMVEASGAPIYAWYPTFIEPGVTAGSFVSFEKMGELAGQLAGSILLGQVPAAGATLPLFPAQCIANGKQLAAMGLDPGLLPPGCQIVNQPPSLWREHREALLAATSVIVLQAASIIALLIQRSRRQRAEAEAIRRREQLTRTARMASVGEISASIAHEVDQPLGAILSNADAADIMLGQGTRSNEELHQILADVRRDALRAHEVVRRLRGLLQQRTVEFSLFDPAAAVAETLALLEPEARRRRAQFERELDSGGVRVFGDAVQLQQVVLNLVVNALDAMAQTPVDLRVVAVSLGPLDGGVELRISDRGHGFEAAGREQIFRTPFTTKPQGMGLGLSIVRLIIEAHGGRIDMSPRQGGGTVFAVWLPGSDSKGGVHASAGRRSQASRVSDNLPGVEQT